MADPVTGGAAIAAWLESMAAATAAEAAVAPALVTAGEVGMAAAPIAAADATMGGGVASLFGPTAGAVEPALAANLLEATPSIESLGSIAQGAQAGSFPVSPWDRAMGELGYYGDKLGRGYDNLPKLGQKMVDASAMSMVTGDGQQPMPQGGGGPRMNGQQQQAQPVAVDYGGAIPHKPAGGAALLGIDDEELKRLLMSLRGY